MLPLLDYLKLGPYDERLGGLDSLFTELGFDLLLYRRTEESE